MNKHPTLICDLDNTLYDWVSYFVPSLYAMIDVAAKIVGCNADELVSEIKSVHQFHRNTEHPFALLETNLVRNWLKTNDLRDLDAAFYAFNSNRSKKLVLYPKVIGTLRILLDSGVKIFGHSDSNLYGVIDRVQRLDILPYFEKIYCIEASDSLHPMGSPRSDRFKNFPFSKLELLEKSAKKPNISVIESICAYANSDKGDTYYIGDSISKDIRMAHDAGINSIYAKYGADFDRQLYSDLVRVSHWSEFDIDEEAKLRNESLNIKPDYICYKSFDEVLDYVFL